MRLTFNFWIGYLTLIIIRRTKGKFYIILIEHFVLFVNKCKFLSINVNFVQVANRSFKFCLLRFRLINNQYKRVEVLFSPLTPVKIPFNSLSESSINETFNILTIILMISFWLSHLQANKMFILLLSFNSRKLHYTLISEYT